MSVLDIKMMRDLWALRTQVLSIALLIAAGIAVFVMSVSNYLALVGAMDAHYRNERFADLFASLKRAPISLVERIREIDGVGVAEPRVTQAVRVIREDSELPISGRIISIPSSDQPLLNRLYLIEGRWIDPARPEEIIINAAAHLMLAQEQAQVVSVMPPDEFARLDLEIAAREIARMPMAAATAAVPEGVNIPRQAWRGVERGDQANHCK